MARRQRVRGAHPGLLVRRLGGGVPRLARQALRHPRRAERRVVDRLLVAAVLRLVRGHPAATHAVLPQPDPPARLQAILVGRPARPVPRRARHHPVALARRQADHHQLHAVLPARRLLGLGPGGGRGQRRLVPRSRRSPLPRRGRSGGRPHALARRRPAVAADGAGRLGHQLAQRQPAQVRWRLPPLVTPAGGPRCRRRPALPVAGGRRRCREVALRDAAARRTAHAHVARGRGARGGARVAAGGCGRAHAGRRGDRPRLVVVVGARARLAPVDARCP